MMRDEKYVMQAKSKSTIPKEPKEHQRPIYSRNLKPKDYAGAPVRVSNRYCERGLY